MSRTHYQIYQEQTFVLAKTLIVKHEEIASSMNTELYYRGYVIDSNPYNWRYYLNLNGEYHQADKDELYEKHGTEYIMVKLPSDAGPVDVPLTKELLHGDNADKAMMNEYQIGSKFYTELVSRYPDFESLIIGILNPIERGVAIKADNGEILFIAGRYKKMQGDRKWFDTTWYSINEVLIEPQEDNLILELQRYIDTFLKHWNNPEYMDGNDLYVVTMLGILYCNIPNAIANIRLGNCKTVRAHTFHIRQYLESHGQIGRYVDFIPIASSLWLYRNIEYLEANTGKQLTFDAILDNVLTPNEIPMSAYSVRHELSNMGDDKLLPTGMLYKETLNFEVVGASDDDRTVLDILEDQSGLARDNHLDLDDTAIHIQDTIDWGGDDRLNTKVLESEMMELGEPYPFTLSQFLFNMWGYTAIKGYYTGSAFATNPLTGDRMSFSSKNAYILAHYCLNKGVAGIELTRIPKVRLYNIPKTNQTADLPSDPIFKLKPDINKIMTWCVSNKTRRLKALEVVGTQIPNFYAQDAEAFFSHVHDIYDERIRRYNTYCDVEEVEERGDLELVAKRLYWMNFEETVLDMSYEDWFRTVGFDPVQFDDNDLLNLGLELVASATGIVDQDNIRKKWLQKSLLAIMKHFISYTVHVIEKFADGVVAYLEGQSLRYSDFKFSYTGGLPVKYNLSLDYKAHSLLKQALRIDISNVFENTVVDIKAQVNAGYDLSNLKISQTAQKFNVGVYALSAEISNIEFNTEQALPVYILVIDEVVNTFMLTRVNGRVRDDSLKFTLPTSDFALSLDNKYGLVTDAFIKAFGYDTGKHSTVVDGVYADVTDSTPKPDTRVDTTGVSMSGIQGGMVDGLVDPIGFVDSLSGLINHVTANLDDTTDTNDRTLADISGAVVTGMNAGISDSPVMLSTFMDDSNIIIGDMSLMLTDPQIPTVVAPVDTHAAIVTNISGTSQDIVNDSSGFSSSGIVLYNIDVDVEEDYIELELGVDDSVVAIGDISADIVDDGELPTMFDIDSSILTGNVELSVSDNADAISVIDGLATTIVDVTATMTDSTSAVGTSFDSMGITNISGVLTDNGVDVVPSVDLDSVSVNNVTLSTSDYASRVTSEDSNNVTIGSINMRVRDDNATASHIDNIAVTLVDVQVDYSEDNVSRGVDDVAGLMVNNITGLIRNVSEELELESNDSFVVYDNLIAVNLNDIEVDLNLSDNHKLSIDNPDITISVIDDDEQYELSDNKHTVTVKPVDIIIVDGEETYSLPTHNDAVMVNPKSVKVNVINDIPEFDIGDRHAAVVNANTLTLTLTDTLVKSQSIDNDAIVIASGNTIQINITDESDDSNTQP